MVIFPPACLASLTLSDEVNKAQAILSDKYKMKQHVLCNNKKGEMKKDYVLGYDLWLVVASKKKENHAGDAPFPSLISNPKLGKEEKM